MTVGYKYVGGSFRSNSIGFWEQNGVGSVTRQGEILGKITIRYCHVGEATKSLQCSFTQADPKEDLWGKYNFYITINGKRCLMDYLNDRSGNDVFYYESKNTRDWTDFMLPLVGKTVDCLFEFVSR